MLGPALRWKLRTARFGLRWLRHFEPRERHCPVCENRSYFLPFGDPPRFEARCQHCGSLERHRLIKVWIDQNAGLVARCKVLHFAPESCVEPLLRQMARSYQSTSLRGNGTDLALNIERIDLPGNHVDLVLCSHVLEHVDDRKALAELYRILAPGGIALILTPVREGSPTYEDATITSSADRYRHFGQDDHLRIYGSDIRERFRAVGFDTTEFSLDEPVASSFGVGDRRIFVCQKTRA